MAAAPAGPLTVACAWPDRGIAETTVELDGDEIVRAAARARPALAAERGLEIDG